MGALMLMLTLACSGRKTSSVKHQTINFKQQHINIATDAKPQSLDFTFYLVGQLLNGGGLIVEMTEASLADASKDHGA